MSGLALPPIASSSSTLDRGASVPKKRKRPRPVPSTSAAHATRDLSRALDADDDVSEDELVAAPYSRGSRSRLAAGGDGHAHANGDADADAGSGDGQGEAEADDESGDDDEVDEAGEVKGGLGKGKSEGIGGMERVWRERKGDQLLLREQLDPDQARRYDAFSTVVLPTQAITRLNRELLDQRLNSHLAKIVGSLGKVFLTELVEIAKDIQPSTANPTGPLRPYHLRLAKARLDERGVTRPVGGREAPSLGSEASTGVGLRPKKRLFKR